MEIKTVDRYAVVATDIKGINNKEMRQMHEMKERIAQVINSHKDEKVKNEYLTDDELMMIHAILHVFTKDFSSSQTSAFDDALKELNKPVEEKPTIPVGEDQTFG